MTEITALNYCTKAIDDLQKIAELYKPLPITYKTIHVVRELLQDAVKFLMPNCGELIDINEFNQNHYDLLKLPYPLTAFEAPWKNEHISLTDGQVLSEKRIALVIENEHDILKELPQFDFIANRYKDDGGAFVLPISELENSFMLLESCCFLPYKSQLSWEQPNSNAAFRIEPICLLPEIAEIHAQQEGFNRVKELAFEDSKGEAQMVLQACAVMNCENIEIEDMQVHDKLKKARSKKNKTPFFDYKILGIGQEFYQPNGVGSSKTEKGKKRMHLRRGHIRRYETGKTTWVRNSVVNASEAKQIKKDYKIKPLLKN